MNSSLESSLRDLGLHKSEASVYLFLLRNGTSVISNVSHGTNIARTNCYYVIRQLLEKGLVEKRMLGKKEAFATTDLSMINNYLSSKKQILKEILPELESSYYAGSIKPQIRFYSTEKDVRDYLSRLLIGPPLIFYGPVPGDPEMIKSFYKSLTERVETGWCKIKHPSQSLNCYFILWEDHVAIAPISLSPHLTVIRNSDIYQSISAMAAI
jgi:sugar-specific transcriptional regulator TrmB